MYVCNFITLHYVINITGVRRRGMDCHSVISVGSTCWL